MPPETTLILVATASLTEPQALLVRDLARGGVRVVAWQHPSIAQERFPSPDVLGALEARGIRASGLSEALGENGDGEVEDAVIAWMKALGRAHFRDLFRYGNHSLWWWAELFLYHDTPLRLHVRDIEALARLCEREKPERVVLVGPVRDLEAVARSLASRVEVHGECPRPWRSSHRTTLRYLGALVKMWGTTAKAFFRSAPKHAGCRFLFLTHASMWKERRNTETDKRELYELYFDPIIPTLASAGERVRAVAVGPLLPFKMRGLRARLAEVFETDSRARPYVTLREYFPKALAGRLTRAFLDCRRDWLRFRDLARRSNPLSHRGVRLGRPALDAFRDTFLLQIPWAIRSYHEVLSCLETEKPAVLALYAESSGLGRAAVAAAKDAGVPTFALQHGIMYPRYYSHEHAADEVDDCPLPTRTAVFGSLARDLLVERSHYRPETIVVTGSPKFDALVAAAQRYDRGTIRAAVGVPDGAPVLVVASRFSAIGRVFRDLVRAAESVPQLVLLVKPHQAERPDRYVAIAREEGASRVRVLTGSENLLELLFASDGLVTVDSLASSEALVLGRPVLVVNLPSNLTPLVERGVALGARRGEDLRPRIEALLFDADAGRELSRRRQEYIQEFAFGADGGSTERIVTALRETAGVRP